MVSQSVSQSTRIDDIDGWSFEVGSFVKPARWSFISFHFISFQVIQFQYSKLHFNINSNIKLTRTTTIPIKGGHTTTQATYSAANTIATRSSALIIWHGADPHLIKRKSLRAIGLLVRGGILIRIETRVLMIVSWYVLYSVCVFV